MLSSSPNLHLSSSSPNLQLSNSSPNLHLSSSSPKLGEVAALRADGGVCQNSSNSPKINLRTFSFNSLNSPLNNLSHFPLSIQLLPKSPTIQLLP